MTTVKGSREYQWRVVKYRPGLRIGAVLGVTAFVVTSVLVAYWGGQHRAAEGHERALSDLTAVRTKLDSSRAEEQRLRREIENAKLGTEVDRQSLESVRQELLQLKSDLASLEEENQFYRNLMAPAGNQRGLNFGTVELSDTDQVRTYHYKVVMQQLATQHELLNGTLSFNIVGRQDGEVRVLSLHEASEDVGSANIKLRFKYFQNIEGRLVLPDGFEPERIELEARSTGKNATTINKRFGWLVRESVAASNP